MARSASRRRRSPCAVAHMASAGPNWTASVRCRALLTTGISGGASANRRRRLRSRAETCKENSTGHARPMTVALVVPDICHDMHDCGVTTGDTWARTHLDPYLQWASSHNSLLIITFDENDGSRGNQILTIVAGAGVAPAQHSEPTNHYSIFQAIDDLLGLPPLGAAASVHPINPLTG
jgi:hypothetical protein